MPITQTFDKPEITLSLVTNLITEQFPQWAHLSIRPVKRSGWDNRTFHLGKEMSVRLPSAAGYVPQVQKEQKWLPRLAPHLFLPIPGLLAVGKPSKHYPWNWSVYRWIEGESADTLHVDGLQQFAPDLAQFLNELHKIDVTDGPLAGAHNYYRGDSPAVYDSETRSAITKLQGLINVDAVISVCKKAMSSKWRNNPVWIHGDFSAGNMLVKDGRLAAIIDFGCMGVGDPACDLVIAWTLLSKENRKIFRSYLGLDPDTWARARGWALWKALITLVPLEDKTCTEALKEQQVIDEILDEHELANLSNGGEF